MNTKPQVNTVRRDIPRQNPGMYAPGTLCIVENQTVQIDGWSSTAQARVRSLVTGLLSTVGISQIAPLPAAPKMHEAGHVGETEWKRSLALAKDFETHASQRTLSEGQWKALAKKHELGIRQLQRLRKAYLDAPAVSSLVRQTGGRPNGTSLLLPEINALIWKTIDKYYLRREGTPKIEVVERVRALARRLKMPVPSRNAILLRIARLSPLDVDTARLGAKAARQRWQPRPGGLRIEKALDMVQIDHTLADVMLVSDDRLKVIGRPWITVAIDVATRCVLGLYVAMHSPCSMSVALCIEHAVLPKTGTPSQSDLWPMCGKPKKILVDNGKDFRAEALSRGCEEHMIELEFRPVKRPHYGAHIERLIGTLMGLTHRLRGTTFSNIAQRGDYQSAANATLTLSEYRQWLTETICRYYHVRKHRGLGIPPLVAWERAFTSADGVIKPPAIPRALEFRLDFFPLQWRKVQRTGIELHRTRYWHDDLAPLLNQMVAVRYHPAERRQVYVRRPDGVLVIVSAIAGLAVDPTPRPAIDLETRTKLEQMMGDGFVSRDAICDSARNATLRALKRPEAKAPAEPASTKERKFVPAIEGELSAELLTEEYAA